MTSDEKIKAVIEFIIDKKKITPSDSPVEITDKDLPLSRFDLFLILEKFQKDEKIIKNLRHSSCNVIDVLGYSISTFETEPLFNNYAKKYVSLTILDSLPQAEQWEDITITFIDGHNVKNKIGTKSLKVNYQEMGFEDKKTKKPNKQWDLLYELSRNNGILQWGSISQDQIDVENEKIHHYYEGSVSRTFPSIPNKYKKRVELLSKQLKKYYRVAGSPFYTYKKGTGYKIKINLLPD